MNPHFVYAIMAAGTMPYLYTTIAKAGAFGPSQNHRTREWQAELDGWRKRAHWAQQNSFEGLPLFIGAVICAALMAPSSPYAVYLAWAYVGTRVLYGVCYLKNWARPRTLTFFVGIATIVGLFVEALRA